MWKDLNIQYAAFAIICCLVLFRTGVSVLGLYFNSNTMVASKKGIHMLAHKWSSTLRELDFANQPYFEEEMEIAMGYLAHGAGVDLFL